MKKSVLSVFVDESGKFQYPDSVSRFYIVSLVLHDQSVDVGALVRKLDSDWVLMGYEDFCFHAGPLIRKEKGYEIMSRKWRGRIFSRMMAFAQKVPFQYHCLSVDKKLIDNLEQIVERLNRQLVDFISEHRADLRDVETVKVYYDCGQSPVTNLLHKTFVEELGKRVEFAQGVQPANYRLFQLADLVCTLHLIERRIQEGDMMTLSEVRLFGGPRDFKRNILKKIKVKEI